MVKYPIHGSNGPCFVRTDIRRDIRVTIDILVELSVPPRISVLTYGYPWRIGPDTMNIEVELSVLAWISALVSMENYGYPLDIHINTGARTVRPGNSKIPLQLANKCYSSVLG